MERRAWEMARVLKELYEESFGDVESEPYRLGWSDLRMLAGVGKVTSEFIADANEGLAESGFALIPFNDFLTITCEADCRHN